MHNEHCILLRTIDDDVIASREAAQAGTQVVAPAADVRVLVQEPKLPSDAVGDAGSDVDASTLARGVEPDVVELGLRFPRDTKFAH